MDFKDKLLIIYPVIMSSIGEVVYNFDSVLLWKYSYTLFLVVVGGQMLVNSYEEDKQEILGGYWTS